MPEYTFADIIMDPNDPRVEVGAEYYFGDTALAILLNARNDNNSGLLKSIKADKCFPFRMTNGTEWALVIRKKEPTYAECQAKWIADNDVKVGDKVRVTRKANSIENGWQSLWNPDMDEAVLKVGTVSYIPANWGECGIEVDVPDVGEFMYPYFVLEKVEPRYVPFDLSIEEDRARLRGAWVRSKENGDEHMIFAVLPSICRVYVGEEEPTARLLFKNYEFLDGTPCGKRTEEVANG